MNRSKRNIAALASGVCLSISAVVAPTAIAAPEDDTGPLTPTRIAPPKDLPKEIFLPEDTVCYAWTGNGKKAGESCLEWHGDRQYVRDTYDNGHEFRVHVRTDYGKDSWCNSTSGYWRYCDFNHREDSYVKWHGYHPPHWANDKEVWTDHWHSVKDGSAGDPT